MSSVRPIVARTSRISGDASYAIRPSAGRPECSLSGVTPGAPPAEPRTFASRGPRIRTLRVALRAIPSRRLLTGWLLSPGPHSGSGPRPGRGLLLGSSRRRPPPSGSPFSVRWRVTHPPGHRNKSGRGEGRLPDPTRSRAPRARRTSALADGAGAASRPAGIRLARRASPPRPHFSGTLAARRRVAPGRLSSRAYRVRGPPFLDRLAGRPIS